jgi:hypothetical protein
MPLQAKLVETKTSQALVFGKTALMVFVFKVLVCFSNFHGEKASSLP